MRALLPLLLLLTPCRSQLSHELTKLQRQGVQTPHILFMVPEAPHPAEGGPEGSEEVASSEERRPEQDTVFVPFAEGGPGLVRFEPRPNHEEAHPLPEHGPPFVQEAPNVHGPVIHQGQYLRPPHGAIHPHPGPHPGPQPGQAEPGDNPQHYPPSREDSQGPHHPHIASQPDRPLDRRPGPPPSVYQIPPQLHAGPGIGPHIIIQGSGPGGPHVIQQGSQPIFVPAGPPHGHGPRAPQPPQDFVILRIFNDSSQPQLIDENPTENLRPDIQSTPEVAAESEKPRPVLPVAEIAESADIVGSLSEEGDKGQSSGGEGQPSMSSSSSESAEETDSGKSIAMKPKESPASIEKSAEVPQKNQTVSSTEIPPMSSTEAPLISSTETPATSTSEVPSISTTTQVPTTSAMGEKKESVIVFMSNGPLTQPTKLPEEVTGSTTEQPSTTALKETTPLTTTTTTTTTTTSAPPAQNPESGSPSELEPVIIVWSEPPSDPSTTAKTASTTTTTTTTSTPAPSTESIEFSSSSSESSEHGSTMTSGAQVSSSKTSSSTESPVTTPSTTTTTKVSTTTTTEKALASSEEPPSTAATSSSAFTPEPRVTTDQRTINVSPDSSPDPTTSTATSTTTTMAPSTTTVRSPVVEIASSTPIVESSSPTETAASVTTSSTTSSSTSSTVSTVAPTTPAPKVSTPTMPASMTVDQTSISERTTTSSLPSSTTTTTTSAPTTPSTTTTVASELSSEPFDFVTERDRSQSTASPTSASPSPAYVPTEAAVAESNASEVTANEISNETAKLPETTIVFANEDSLKTDAPVAPEVTQRPPLQRPTVAPSAPTPSPSPSTPPPTSSRAPTTVGPPKYYELPTEKEKPSVFPTQTVRTRNGQMKGNVIKTSNGVRVNSFLGIPYAQPPVGSMRFERPMEFPPWTGVFEAKKLPKSCPQPTMQLNGFVGVNISDTSEDCLYLNIWSPFCDGAKKCRSRPVIVYIHGGGFIHGGVNWPIFDGAELSSRAEVVVVSLNYRLGALGFLYVPSNGGRPERANMGLYDQHLALRWVKSNIKAFGGDHNKITIMGQDAGSASVGYHILTPRSTGLFKRAVMQSGSPFSFVLRNTKDQGETLFRSLASYTDCMSVHFNSTLRYDDVLQCMKKQPFENIIAASEKFNGKGANSFFPIMGEEFIPMNPKDSLLLKRFSNVDLLVTTTKSEGAFFLQHFLSPFTNVADADKINPGEIVFYLRVFLSALLGGKPTASLNELTQNTEPETREEKVQFLKNISAVIGDYPFLCATTDFGLEYANLRHNVYHMQYDHRPWFLLHPTWFPSTHGDDIMFWLGSVYKLKERTRADERVADELMAILTAFAAKGTPQTRGKLTWPRINQGGYYMSVGSEVTELLRTPPANCRYWTRHYPQY